MEQQVTNTPRRLTEDSAAVAEITVGGEPHAYEIDVPAGHYLRLVAEQHGGDLMLRLLDPAGRVVADVDSPIGTAGSEQIGTVADGGGTYVAEVHPAGTTGAYRLRIAELRAATAADRLRSAAEKRFAAGEGKRRQVEHLAEPKRRQTRVEAQDEYLAALELFRQAEDVYGQAQALHRLAEIERGPKGETRLASAAALFAEIGDRRWQAVCLNRMAYLRLADDDPDAAADLARRAAEVAPESNADDVRASAHTFLGDSERNSGRMLAALDAYRRARELWQQLDTAEALQARQNNWLRVGGIYILLDEIDPAVDAMERAAEIADARGDDRGRATALTRLADALLRRGDHEPALGHLEEALALREGEESEGTAFALTSLGNALLAAERFDEAGDAYRRAHEIFEREGNPVAAATVLNRQGHLLRLVGDFEESLAHHRRAADAFAAESDRPGLATARYGIAHALFELGRLPEARHEIETNLELFEQITEATGQIELRAAYVGSKDHYWKLYVDVLMALHDGTPERRFDLLALDVTERWRARRLRDLIARSTLDGRTAATPAGRRLQRAQQELNAAQLALEEARAAGVDEKAVRRRRTDAIAELQSALSEVRGAGPRPAANEATGSVSRLRSSLEPDTLVLVYSVGEQRSYVWAVSRDGVHSRRLGENMKLDRLVRRARPLLASIADADAEPRRTVLQALSGWAIAPVVEALAAAGSDFDDYHRLVVVPDAELRYVPFGPLPNPSAAGHLVDRYEISYQISISALLSMRRRRRPPAQATIAVVADPVFAGDDPRIEEAAGGERVALREASGPLARSLRDFDRSELARLPGTAREAQAIRKALPPDGRIVVLEGTAASRDSVLADVPSQARILHFATHGLVNSVHPELTGLALSNFDADGHARDGFLRVHEIYGLELAAELVVLSGCDTGLGRDYPGEGLVGMAQAFMTAGAPRVLVSLWPVDDEATATLMGELYVGLLQKGMTPAAALRQAQLARSSSGAPPADWAGFVLLGDWRLGQRLDDPIEGATSGGGEEPPPDPQQPDDPLPGPPGAPRKPPGDGDRRLYFNGLRADGEYLHAPADPATVGRELLARARSWSEPPTDDRGRSDSTRRPRPEIDVHHLDQAGWAVIFAAGVDPMVRTELGPLLDRRKAEAGQHYKELVLSPGQSLDDFLAERRAPLGVADPFHLPYYVLLVGGPDEISFSFQQELDLVYAVGRLDLEKPSDYAAYANAVLAAEQRGTRRRRAVAFWGAENDGDRATRRTHRDLVAPLADHVHDKLGWPVDRHLGADAGRDRLLDLLSGDTAPAMLFTGGHGLRIDGDPEDQRQRQGALITSDWPGEGYVLEEHCVAADDLTGREPADGLVVFNFACYSGGTPAEDGFEQEARAPKRLARRPFVSALSRRLLGRHGALAVVGHVDRAWTTSFDWYRDTGQRAVFECALDCLLRGEPVGAAMEYFGQLTGDLALRLAGDWERSHQRKAIDEARFARRWIAHNDARNFAVFGDPAVRLAVG